MKKEQKIHTCKTALTILEVINCNGKQEENRNADCKACTWMVDNWVK